MRNGVDRAAGFVGDDIKIALSCHCLEALQLTIYEWV
jgi:hypothetical protein